VSFLVYYEDVKNYRLLQPRSNEIIIRRDVKFDENRLAYEPNSTFVPSSTCEPYLVFVPYYVHTPISSSSNDNNENENSPPPTHIPQNKSIEHELAPTP
jgi:hypothetical protein